MHNRNRPLYQTGSKGLKTNPLYALRQTLKDHVEHMEKSGEIEKIKESTDLGSNLVIVPKANQKLRKQT